MEDILLGTNTNIIQYNPTKGLSSFQGVGKKVTQGAPHPEKELGAEKTYNPRDITEVKQLWE